jgi:hypothetical protein
MKALWDLIGIENYLDQVSAALRQVVRGMNVPVVGALEVNCSDESEAECSSSFQQQFVEHLLPDLKSGVRGPLRTCNLGARYEWGSIRVAEQHFAAPASHDAFKVLVVKLNGHVAVVDEPDGPRYGPMQRYDAESNACGALHAMLSGDDWPALQELRESFRAGGHDRIATLLDTRRVPPPYRYVFAAMVGARLQAARVVQDIRAHQPHSPTWYLVVPCVTFNRAGPDTELVVGYCSVDGRSGKPEVRYEGLGDDPARYHAECRGRRLHITEA